jgi:predicted dehydrogenase
MLPSRDPDGTCRSPSTKESFRVRILQLGVDHPHGVLYRETIAHHPGLTLAGAYDADPEGARRLLASEGIDVPLFADISEAIAATEPDVALVTLPNDVTPAAIALAARHGLAIIAEKPSAVSAAAFQPAHEAVRATGVPFVAAYLRRFSPVATALRGLIADGILGDLVAAQITFVTTNVALRNATYLRGEAIEHAGPADGAAQTGDARHWLFDRARSGGGIMYWLGVHWIDLLRFASGEEFAHATATLTTRTPVPIDVEDVASVTLETRGEMVATIACAYALHRGPDQLTIALQGTHGWATWDGVGPELRLHSAHPSWQSEPARTLRFPSEPLPGYGGAMGWALFDGVRAAREENMPLPMDIDDALRVLEILDAVQASGHEHRRVAIEHA